MDLQWKKLLVLSAMGPNSLETLVANRAGLTSNNASITDEENEKKLDED